MVFNLATLRNIVENELLEGDILEFPSSSYEGIKIFIREKCRGDYEVNKRIELLVEGGRNEYVFIKKIN